MAANDIAYINEHFEGGIEAYKASHDARFSAAVAAGDVATMAKLQADANRVGFSLNPIGVGVSPAKLGSAPAKLGSIAGGSAYNINTGMDYPLGGGGGGTRPSVAAGGGGATSLTGNSGSLSDLGIKSGASDLLPMVLVGAFVVFIAKVIFN